MTPSTVRASGPELLALAQDAYGDYLNDLRTLVGIDCGTYFASGVNRVADRLQERFGLAGWSVERVPHHAGAGEAQLGDVLIAQLQGGTQQVDGGHRVLLVGHMDTVFPEGTVAERPFRTEDGMAYGPGVSDMKGGLLAGVYAVGCLRRSGFDSFESITYVCNPDEEIGSPFSSSVIRRRAELADVAFVLEGARENGDIVSARKGVSDIRIEILGRAAHAGVEPERGRSATLQGAYTTALLHELNGRWPGVTVNVGVVRGGTRPNVVAERCELHVDVRGPDASTFAEAIEEVERLARRTQVPDTSVEVTRASGFPPMEKTQETARLADRARRLAEQLGFELRDAATGGASDANHIAEMGVPVLDGLGPIGGADHSPGEWLDLTSVVPRMALLAGLIASPNHPE